jgi:hypothetical protein
MVKVYRSSSSTLLSIEAFMRRRIATPASIHCTPAFWSGGVKLASATLSSFLSSRSPKGSIIFISLGVTFTAYLAVAAPRGHTKPASVDLRI